MGKSIVDQFRDLRVTAVKQHRCYGDQRPEHLHPRGAKAPPFGRHCHKTSRSGRATPNDLRFAARQRTNTGSPYALREQPRLSRIL
jgi:hypothetical protein